jgi:HD-GYP domain-containing protein (c-di-GMP phosphodiesterase class II)
MRLCPLSEVAPGMMLGRSIFNEKGQLLLRAGFCLTSDVLPHLLSLAPSAVYILEAGTEEIVPIEIISEEARARATQAFNRTMDTVSAAVVPHADLSPKKLRQMVKRDPQFRNLVDADRVMTEMASIVDEILDSNTQFLDQLLIKSRNAYHTQHAVDTALVALLIGRKFQFRRAELVELGTGAFLHDLGEVALPTLMDKLESDMTDDERMIYREHPVLGQQLLANSTDRFFMAQTAILHHHERQDGMGYPLGLIGDNKPPHLNGRDASKYIFPFAEIIAVADAYDDLISQRNAGALTPELAMCELVRQAEAAYNATVVKTLLEVISIFPTGAMVQVAECANRFLVGSVGVIMKSNPEKPHQPIIVVIRNRKGAKVTPKTVDLAHEGFARLEMVM